MKKEDMKLRLNDEELKDVNGGGSIIIISGDRGVIDDIIIGDSGISGRRVGGADDIPPAEKFIPIPYTPSLP